MKNIAVIGTGYVGLVTGTCFAETGNNVVCVDIDANKVERMQNGEVPIYEPQLDVLFERNKKQGRLKFSTDLETAVADAEIIFLALPTPPGEDGSADLSYILGVADQLGKIIKDYKVIIDKSTVPVGTAEKVKNAISKNTQIGFDVVSNPEFLREGYAVSDFLKPDRVVIGTESAKARKILEELYKPFVRQGNPIYFMDEKSAELTKYAANSFLATKITFMNEIANFCEKVGADVDMVRKGIGSDARIGNRFLFPGIGYGGSCFPKDVQALVNIANDHGYNPELISSVERVNKAQKKVLFSKLVSQFGNDLKGKKIAIWGLSFKPETDDMREAPSINLIQSIVKAGGEVSAYDPKAMDEAKFYLKHIKVNYCNDKYTALDNADALILVTEWKEFRSPDFDLIKSKMNGNLFIDGRNQFKLDYIQNKGFKYVQIGVKA